VLGGQTLDKSNNSYELSRDELVVCIPTKDYIEGVFERLEVSAMCYEYGHVLLVVDVGHCEYIIVFIVIIAAADAFIIVIIVRIVFIIMILVVIVPAVVAKSEIDDVGHGEIDAL
jgi:hypothetical protein